MKSLFLALIALTGCGAQDGASSAGATPTSAPAANSAAQTSMYVADQAGLPPCDEAHANWLAYVASSKALEACISGTWTAVDLPKGADGKDGAAGKDGKDGASGKDGAVGKDGADNHFAAKVTCNGDVAGPIKYTYEAAVTSTGDVIATAAIRDGGTESAKTQFYSSTQNGADKGNVIFVSDVLGASNAGFWSFAYDKTAKVVTIEYTDADAPNGKDTYTGLASDCSAISN